MRVVLCGDFLFSSRHLMDRIDPKIVELLKGADAVFANAEFSTPRQDTPPGFTMYLTSVHPVTLNEFVDLNIKLVNFANNHTVDYGWRGCLDTIEEAEARDIEPCGVGRNLSDARKAKFLDTAKGRVSVVAASSTWSDRALGADASADTVARPGLAPLRWGHTYYVTKEQFEQLKAIDQAWGTRESMDETGRVETWAPQGETSFKLGSAMEHYLYIEQGERAEVKTYTNEEDEDALLRSIRDAARRSDYVIASVHSHEGKNENWYSDFSPEFLEEYAHKAIDAGASVFVSHGAHYPRGMEVYKGKPIFYDLGSTVMEFEAGNSMVSPEMYHTYHLPVDAYPSDLHSFRAKFEDGSWKGFYAERRFSEHFIVVVDIDDETGETKYELLPIDIDMQRDNPIKRGLPFVASDEAAEHIAEEMARRSEPYGTEFAYNKKTGMITFQ
ncbi:CapA family protein [Cuneatibacter sp. NSJ-177]|uniref:CapA family protein n=1 Tax=Cuneatibacter sp. NSJ-177 TaxID=2931401 RepID=UPI001FD4EF72|nr:CapA family protein [Cuneatibacter sp. NSJ-177]MCJ7835285.1 CapA family protein [Cuneatibacter sp. NSJ-177]